MLAPPAGEAIKTEVNLTVSESSQKEMRGFKKKHQRPLEFSISLATFLQYKQTWSPNMILFVLGKGRGG